MFSWTWTIISETVLAKRNVIAAAKFYPNFSCQFGFPHKVIPHWKLKYIPILLELTINNNCYTYSTGADNDYTEVEGKRRLEMEDIKDVAVGPMPQSDYLKPLRMTFTQNGKQRFWDFIKVHESVSCILFNTSRNVLLFVKQFRPVVYYNSALKTSGDNSIAQNVDWEKVPGKNGVTIELCAGIIDEKLPHVEVAKKEVLEECGYDIPLANFQKIINYTGGVGSNGDRVTIFYAECTDAMKVSEGGGLASEGELIDVVEMTISEVRDYIAKDYVNSPGGFLFAVQWFLANKAPKC